MEALNVAWEGFDRCGKVWPMCAQLRPAGRLQRILQRSLPFLCNWRFTKGMGNLFSFLVEEIPFDPNMLRCFKTSLIATITAVPQLLVKAWQVFKNKVTLQWVLRYWPAKEIRNICWVSTIQRPLLLFFSWCPFFPTARFSAQLARFAKTKGSVRGTSLHAGQSEKNVAGTDAASLCRVRLRTSQCCT